MNRELKAELEQLYSATGFKRLNPIWAKLEILFGLFAMAASIVVVVKFSREPEASVPEFAWLGPIALFTLGGYLALAGHRSHLYQSANILAAYSNLPRNQ
jgi:hypothetical protein